MRALAVLVSKMGNLLYFNKSLAYLKKRRKANCELTHSSINKTQENLMDYNRVLNQINV